MSPTSLLGTNRLIKQVQSWFATLEDVREELPLEVRLQLEAEHAVESNKPETASVFV
jgi:hypothetical protein